MRGFSAEIRPLTWLEPAAAVAAGLVLLALVVADVNAAIRGALLVTLAVSVFAMRRELRRTAAVRYVAWDGEECWTWNGEPVSVGAGTRVHPGLVVLAFEGARRDVHWIPRAAVAPEAFRRLKAALRHGQPVGAGGPRDGNARRTAPKRAAGRAERP